MSAEKKYICTHDLTIKGKTIKAGTPIPASKMTKKTIKQYVDGGLLRDALSDTDDIVTTIKADQ